LIKAVLTGKAKTCVDYFEQPDKRVKIMRYRRVYQEVMQASVGLFPYVVLVRELGFLLEP
jgi:hypothetical protein